jgi:hypothetical protein
MHRAKDSRAQGRVTESRRVAGEAQTPERKEPAEGPISEARTDAATNRTSEGRRSSPAHLAVEESTDDDPASAFFDQR